MAYQVTEIQVVKPEEVSILKIQEGQDLASIITCTPYGLNTHRLIVTGKRVPYEAKKANSMGEELTLCKGIGVYPVAVCVTYYYSSCISGEKGDGEHMKRNMMTRFSAGCLALLLTFGSVCSVQAAQEPAEPNTGQETQTGQSPEQTVQTGSVTVQLTPGKEGTSVADVEFFLTQVGEIQDSTYTLLPEYENTKIDLNTLTTAEQLEEAAKTLAETAKQEQGKKNGWKRTKSCLKKQELGV